MAFDLDNEELKATRKDKGLDDGLYEETSDKNVVSEDDLEELNDVLLHYRETREVRIAIKHLLAEREQDKKRIKELEEENKKYIVQLTDEQYRNLVKTIRKEAKQEFEQKVKDKIEEYDKRMEEDAGHPNWVITDRIVMNVLQELLEGEK